MLSASAPLESAARSRRAWKRARRNSDSFPACASYRDEVVSGLDMSVLNEIGPADKELQSYLLGLLPDEDAERLDELSIIDDQVAERLRIVEDDLVDAYVNGELTGATLERFESHYLASE